MAVIGIIVFCGVVVGAAALLLNRPGQKKKMKNIKENNFSKRGSNNEGSDY